MSKAPRKRPTPKRVSFPDLGALDVCLNVKDIGASVEFYENLGFRQAEGERSKGWSVQERDGVRIGLFSGYIEATTLNFRGGNVGEIVGELKRRGMKPYKVKIRDDKEVGNAHLKDPDGHLIFFDSTREERDRRKAQLARR